MNEYVHKVGSRKEREISFHATADNFLDGCRFNDSLHDLANNRSIGIPKGVYFFHTHEEADRQRIDCLVKTIAALNQR